LPHAVRTTGRQHVALDPVAAGQRGQFGSVRREPGGPAHGVGLLDQGVDRVIAVTVMALR
jgi:hypothetical protein